MRVLVCGSRTYDRTAAIAAVLGGYREGYGSDVTVIHGCARGADETVDELAAILGLYVTGCRFMWFRR